jgi:hypothetical protein
LTRSATIRFLRKALFHGASWIYYCDGAFSGHRPRRSALELQSFGDLTTNSAPAPCESSKRRRVLRRYSWGRTGMYIHVACKGKTDTNDRLHGSELSVQYEQWNFEVINFPGFTKLLLLQLL